VPEINWTRVLIIQLSLLASVALVVIAWHVLAAVSHTLLIVLLASLLAFVLAPLVDRLTQEGMPRPAAVGVVYLALALVLLVAGALVSRPFVAQATLLWENWPTYVANLQAWQTDLDRWLEGFGLGGLLSSVQTELARLTGPGGSLLLGDTLRILSQLAGSVIDAIVVIVTSFYLLLVAPRVRQALYAVVPAAHQGKVVFVEESLVRVLGGYLRGQLALAVSLAVVVTLGLQVLGMPYAIVLGAIAGLFELVPMFGPILGALPALGVALFQPYPMVLWVLLFFVVVQQVENHVLVPRISGHAVGLHPLAAILALLAGLELGGFLGAVFAVPVVGFVWVVVAEVYRRTHGEAPAEPAERWRLRRPQLRLRRSAAARPRAGEATGADASPASQGVAAEPAPRPPIERA
jgi:predicted PurR-regulated permease PerM